MKEILKIINELEKTSATNEKINILKRESENELLKKVLTYTYSDNMMYGFSENKLRELLSDGKISKNTWNDVFTMLDILSLSNINDSLRDNVVSFLLLQPEELKELYIKIITKDLRCNISAKTINKAIKGLIKTWDVQQAYPREKYKLKKDEWIALSLKLNGIRSSFINDEFRSRQNKAMLGYTHILNDLKLLGIDDMFVDGELIRKNIDNVSDNENFRLTTSIVNSDIEDKTDIKFVIFDIITKEDFSNGESKLKFKERLELLNTIKNRIVGLHLKHVDVAPVYYIGTDHTMIDKILDEVDSNGYEGLMLLRNYPYKCKRHNGILKCKKFKTADCEIIGYEEGTGKYKGVLGSFIIDYKGNKVNVGSGYTDAQRATYWEEKDSYIGRILEVKFKEESKDKKTELISLQFPTFVCIREKGKAISYN